MKVSTVLRRARKLISKPERWTQEAFARAASGNVIGPESPTAVCFCAVGAVRHVAWPHASSVLLAAERTLDEAARRYRVTESSTLLRVHADDVNDTRDHDTVLKMFDSAIRLAERQEAKARK